MRRSRGISSIYGFIMIFLLSMASIQVWSSAVGSLTQIQGASDQSHQIEEMQGLEHLTLSESDGNLTVANDGQVPSTVEYIRLVDQNDSSTVSLNQQVPIGSSFQVPVKSSYTVEVVTALGDVFILNPPTDPTLSGLTIEQTGAGEANADLFQNPYETSTFYASSGSWVYAYAEDGTRLWSFDGGSGAVTDVMPISGGDVYVSMGYEYSSNAATLYELSPSGAILASYSVRLDQEVSGTFPAQIPVSKGEDQQDAIYDGIFYGPSGPGEGVPSDGLPLATSDASDLYFYQTSPEADVNGVCQGGDEIKLSSYTPSVYLPNPNWTDYFYTGFCDTYPPQMLGATAGGGLVAAVFTEPSYVELDETEYSMPNPYLIIATATGYVYYAHLLSSNGYSGGLATDGSNVYLALPQMDEVQVVNASWRTTSTYSVGFPASQLVWAYGSLFAISDSEVRVYGSGMTLEKTIQFAPLTLSSFSNGFPSETSLQAPSFLPLNSTSYAALLENSTGYTSLVIGDY